MCFKYQYMKRAAISIAAFLLIFISKNNVLALEDGRQSNLRFYLSEDKTSYAGIITVNQVWARYIQNNPDKWGTAQYPDYDIAIRRSRMILYAGLSDKVFFYTQLGYNGHTYREGNNQGLSLINAQTEYILAKDKLHLGIGLHSWNGISRYANSMFAELLVVDNPGFIAPVEGTFVQSGSQLGVYARGSINRLQYRLSVVKPFEAGTSLISSPVTTERKNENFAVKGYFTWQFFDKENSLFPYMTMNNLGNGKLLNIGAGFYYHPEAMLVEAEKDLSTVDPMLAGLLIMAGNFKLLNELADYYPSNISDIFLSAADIFLDLPGKQNSAFTLYLGYFYNFFGSNYLRSMGKMNVSDMAANSVLPQGQGNSEWEVGTGQIIRGEFGYLLPGNKMKSRFQPYGAFTWKSFNALADASLQFDAGINLLLQGHHIKWTLQYSSRPVYSVIEDYPVIDQYKGQIFLQTQVYF